MQIRFASFYIVSLILLGIITVALWTGKENSRSVDIPPIENAGNQQFRELDQSMHAKLKDLQELDERFVFLLSDSAMNYPHRNDSLEKLSSAIYDAGQLLAKEITAAGQLNDTSSVATDKERLTALIGNFKTALQTHKAVSNLSMIMAAKSMTGNDAQALVNMRKWQDDVQKKESRIKILEDRLKQLGGEVATAQSITTVKKQDETNSQQTAGLETKNVYLQNVNKALQLDNDRLLGELAKMNRIQESGEAVSKEKSDLERRVKDLNGELYLARVDCNLSRADAKQIVYNSKQRKDLLAEALSVLNSLSQTGSTSLQKKIKEKTLQLQTIANTVRD